MRHKVSGNQLGRRHNQAKALYRSLLGAIITRGKIETTKAKAKAVQGDLDRLIILSKTDSPNNRRKVTRMMGTGSEKLMDRLFKEIGPAFSAVNSGFSRILKLGQRLSDTAEMVLFELTRMPLETAVAVKDETIVVSAETKEKEVKSQKSKIKSTSKKSKSTK